jgi:hypothetical protein
METMSNKPYGPNECQNVLPAHDERVMDKGYKKREPATNEARRITADMLVRESTNSFDFIGNALANRQSVRGPKFFPQPRFYFDENGKRQVKYE